mgnify:CR=1 FL=1
MKGFFVIGVALISVSSFAKTGMSNVMSIGQGISSPNVHGQINLQSGFTKQNPVGAYYQQGLRFSGQYIDGDRDPTTTDGDSYDALGLELG